MKLITCGLVFLQLFLTVPSYAMSAEDLAAKIGSVIVRLQGELYSLSRDNAAEQDFIEVFRQARQALTPLLEEPDLVLQYPVFNYQGNSLLHEFAYLGYYPLVEMLIEDPRYQSMSTQRNAYGMIPVDLARARFGLYYTFGYPDQLCSATSFVPLSATAEGFYNSSMAPFAKTTALLATSEKGALGLRSVYIRYLDHRYKAIIRNTQPAPPLAEAVRKYFNYYALELRQLPELEDGDFYETVLDIQRHLLSGFDRKSPYKNINQQHLRDFCAAFK